MTDAHMQTAMEERAVEYLEQIGTISPGTICTDEICEAMRTVFEARSGLTRDQYLFSPFGFPPVPMPQEPRPDGTGRVPANCAVDFARHPVWWLPWEVAQRRPGEDDWTWQIRLYVELAERGWWDVDSGDWYDLFADYGWDLDNEVVYRNRVAAYLAGEPDPDIIRFTTPAPEGYESTAAETAEEMVTTLRSVLEPVRASQAQDQQEAAVRARAYIDQHERFESVSASLIEALKTHQADATAGGDGLRTWPTVAEMAETTMRTVNFMFRAVVEVAIPVVKEQAETLVEGIELIEEMEVLSRAQQAERTEMWLDLLGKVRENPIDDTAYATLIEFLRTQHTEVLDRLRNVDRDQATPEVDAAPVTGPAPTSAASHQQTAPSAAPAPTMLNLPDLPDLPDIDLDHDLPTFPDSDFR